MDGKKSSQNKLDNPSKLQNAISLLQIKHYGKFFIDFKVACRRYSVVNVSIAVKYIMNYEGF